MELRWTAYRDRLVAGDRAPRARQRAAVHGPNHPKAPPEDDWTAARTRIIHELAATPDAHLVIVRYQDDHIPDNEWVYNAADIDQSKIVWTREIPGHDVQPLLDYFRGRKVWLLAADADDPELRPYSPAN